MSDFERLSIYYEKGWANESQLQQYVKYDVITAEEYEAITGEPYESPVA